MDENQEEVDAPAQQEPASEDGPGKEYEIYQKNEELVDKLKLLNYEDGFLKLGVAYKPILKHYFVKSRNIGEQFFLFTSLAAWLIKKSGEDSYNMPQEFDDPNSTLANIMAAAKNKSMLSDAQFETTLGAAASWQKGREARRRGAVVVAAACDCNLMSRVRYPLTLLLFFLDKQPKKDHGFIVFVWIQTGISQKQAYLFFFFFILIRLRFVLIGIIRRPLESLEWSLEARHSIARMLVSTDRSSECQGKEDEQEEEDLHDLANGGWLLPRGNGAFILGRPKV